MQKRFSLTRIIAPLLIALCVLAALFAVVTWMPLRTARNEWRAGRYADAIADAERWSQMRMWGNQYHQMLAIAYLASKQTVPAQPHLDALRGKTLQFSVVPKEEVARKLFSEGLYSVFLGYDQAVREKKESADSALYRAAAYASDLNLLSQAEATLQTIDRSAVDAKKLAALQSAIAQRKSGEIPWVVDRDGQVIATVSARSSDVSAANRDFAPLVAKEAGSLTFGAQRDRLGTADDIETTLDSKVQRAAKAALETYRGAFVVIDPRTNELLAIVSNDPHGAPRNNAIEKQYEPGSIVKVLTGLNALGSGLDVQSMFPYHCKGELMIDGRHFGDWLPGGHGVLPDLNEALAESCNVFFADVGLRLGTDRLRHFMASAGFDQQIDLELFTAPLGKFNGDAFNKFETAFMAIGLEHETVTALQVAMLASMMANRGVLTTPRLLRARRSILGEVTRAAGSPAQARLAPQAAADRMVQAMVAVVTRPKGTGRRADIDGVSLALKTGTAGKRENGYQAVIMAFAPVESPQIAFGIIAENAGPAEFAGAKIARDFLAQMFRGRIGAQ